MIQLHDTNHGSNIIKRRHKTKQGYNSLQVVFRNPHEIRRISCEIHPKPYKSKCFNQNYSVWWMQERGYDPGFHETMTPDFMKSGVIAPSMHPPNWRVFVETSDFIRFWVDFTWNPPDFSWMWAFAWWSSIGLPFERPNINCFLRQVYYFMSMVLSVLTYDYMSVMRYFEIFSPFLNTSVFFWYTPLFSQLTGSCLLHLFWIMHLCI